jgi:hypothetical protein
MTFAEEPSGNILFGGIDQAKYLGDLIALPLQEDENTLIIDTFSVVLSAISVTTPSGTSTALSSTSLPFTGVLDSGTTATIIPDDIYTQLASAFNVVYDNTTGYHFISCDIANTKGTIDWQFGGQGGPTIAVPFSEVVLPILNFTTGQQETSDSGTPLCKFGLVSTAAGYDVLIGDTFLRSAYVVYDLDGNQVYIAQSKFDTTASDIVPINADGSAAAGTGSSSGSASSASQSASSIASGSAYSTATVRVSQTGLSSVIDASSGLSLGFGSAASSVAQSLTQTAVVTSGLGAAGTSTSLSFTVEFPSASRSTASAAAAATTTTKTGSGARNTVCDRTLGATTVVLFVLTVLMMTC